MTDLDDLRHVPSKSAPTAEEMAKHIGARALVTGDRVHLSEIDYSVKKLLVGVGWDIPGVDPSGIDVDVSLFLLDKNDQTRDDSDFIFYNNLSGGEGAVQHTGDNRSGVGDGDDERIFIDLQALTFDVLKIVFVISIYDAEMRDQSLTLLKNCFIRVVNQETDIELLRYPVVNEFENHLSSAVVVGELVREGPVWSFLARADEVDGGLGTIATQYGMMVTG